MGPQLYLLPDLGLDTGWDPLFDAALYMHQGYVFGQGIIVSQGFDRPDASVINTILPAGGMPPELRPVQATTVPLYIDIDNSDSAYMGLWFISTVHPNGSWTVAGAGGGWTGSVLLADLRTGPTEAGIILDAVRWATATAAPDVSPTESLDPYIEPSAGGVWVPTGATVGRHQGRAHLGGQVEWRSPHPDGGPTEGALSLTESLPARYTVTEEPDITQFHNLVVPELGGSVHAGANRYWVLESDDFFGTRWIRAEQQGRQAQVREGGDVALAVGGGVLYLGRVDSAEAPEGFGSLTLGEMYEMTPTPDSSAFELSVRVEFTAGQPDTELGVIFARTDHAYYKAVVRLQDNLVGPPTAEAEVWMFSQNVPGQERLLSAGPKVNMTLDGTNIVGSVTFLVSTSVEEKMVTVGANLDSYHYRRITVGVGPFSVTTPEPPDTVPSPGDLFDSMVMEVEGGLLGLDDWTVGPAPDLNPGAWNDQGPYRWALWIGDPSNLRPDGGSGVEGRDIITASDLRAISTPQVELPHLLHFGFPPPGTRLDLSEAGWRVDLSDPEGTLNLGATASGRRRRDRRIVGR